MPGESSGIHFYDGLLLKVIDIETEVTDDLLDFAELGISEESLASLILLDGFDAIYK
jgi:hypothetical protein